MRNPRYSRTCQIVSTTDKGANLEVTAPLSPPFRSIRITVAHEDKASIYRRSSFEILSAEAFRSQKDALLRQPLSHAYMQISDRTRRHTI